MTCGLLIEVLLTSCTMLRMHGKMLLVTFDSDNSAQSHVEALTRELQGGFKKLNAEINGMEVTPGADDSEVRKQVSCRPVTSVLHFRYK